MSKLKGPIVRLTKQKIINATILDVLGGLCSVRLSGRGVTLHSLRYTGPQPAKGDSVLVDYRSGIPIVVTSSSNLEKAIEDLQATLGAQDDATTTVPQEPPDTMPSIDAVRRFISDVAPTVDDDVDLDYEVSDLWLDIIAGAAYICLDNTDGAAEWLNIGSLGGLAVWGGITGTLSAQTDLQAALDAKMAATADYTVISGNDAATDVTGAELEELTDGSTTTLHSHSGGGGLMLVLRPGVSHPPEPVLTPDGTGFLYFQVE